MAKNPGKTKAAEKRKDKPIRLEETPEMRAAYERYAAMGAKRSHTKLAAELGTTKNTVEKWSRAFKWQERIKEYEDEAKKRIEEEGKKAFFKNVDNLTEYKYELLNLLKERIGRTRYCGVCEQAPASVGDIIRVLEVIKTELGEPTSITKGTLNSDKGNPFADLLNKFFPANDARKDAANG